MRKTFQEQLAIEEQRRDGLTVEQRKAMNSEFDRRIRTFEDKWRLCDNRRCRRQRQCLAPPFACNGKNWPPPWTNRQYRWLRQDLIRNPMRVPRA